MAKESFEFDLFVNNPEFDENSKKMWDLLAKRQQETKANSKENELAQDLEEYNQPLDDENSLSEESKKEEVAEQNLFSQTMKLEENQSPLIIQGYGKNSRNLELVSDFKPEKSLEIRGVKNRIEKNLTALETSLKIEQEQRFASKIEQEIIAQFSGWGGLSGVFGGNESFKKENERLKNYFQNSTQDKKQATLAYASALKSSASAYYTSPLVIESIYKALDRLGLKDNGISKEILEPSCGIGSFLTYNRNESFHFTAIELEKNSYTMAKQLNPNQNIHYQSYQSYITELDIKFDAVIGNPPYDNNISINDPVSLGNNQKIVNYFAIKSIENLREGGIMAFVMPTGFLDNNTNAHLDRLMQVGAKFIGAVRLPNSAFKHSGTEVNTDIVFFQKDAKLEISGSNKKQQINEALEQNNLTLTNNSYILAQAMEIFNAKKEENENLDYDEFISSFMISSYFEQNPQNILGKMELEKNQFGDYKAVVKDDGRDLEFALSNFIQSLPQDIYKDIKRENVKKIKDFDFINNAEDKAYIQSLKNGSYFIDYSLSSDKELVFAQKINNKSYQNLSLNEIWYDSLSKENKIKFNNAKFKNEIRLKELEKMRQNMPYYINLRDKLSTLLSAELEETSTQEELTHLRANLNEAYELIKNKNLNDKSLKDSFRGFSNETSFEMISALENNGEKALIFTQRMQNPIISLKISNANEAYVASLSLYGRIDFTYLEKALPQPLEKTIVELLEQQLIFKNHQKEDDYIQRDLYLSGNVKAKYKEVEFLIETQNREDLTLNLKALKEAFPKDKKISEINFNFAQNYIPIEIYQSFLNYYLDVLKYEPTRGNNPVDIRLVENTYLLTWHPNQREKEYRQQSGFYDYLNSGSGSKIQSYEEILKERYRGNKEKFETEKNYFLKLKAIDYAVNRAQAVIKKWNGEYVKNADGEPKIDSKGEFVKNLIVDIELTKDLNFMIKELERSFVEYSLARKDIREMIAKNYNEIINTDAARKFEGNHLSLKGINPNIELRKHQKDGIWRGIQSQNTLFNYKVGAGKTMLGVALAIEQKRMGLVNKPLIVVPNHLVASWRKEIKNLYPNANVLIANENALHPLNRKRFLAQAKMNDYELILMTMEQFKALPKNPQAQISKLLEIIEMKEETLSNLEYEKRTREANQVKKAIQKVESRIRKIEALAADISKENMLTFEELGIDCLIVDEAHKYKNLYYESDKQGVLGLGTKDGSMFAFDMSVVSDFFHQNDKKLYFLTGTPIANSLCEVYHMQRYLQPQWLSDKRIYNFDNWANTFGEDVTDFELGVGGEPKIVTRFSSFKNLTELTKGFDEINDYISNKDIEEAAGAELIPRAKFIKVVAPRSPEIAQLYGIPDSRGNYPEGSLLYRFEHFKDDPVLNNPLRLTSIARKAALDARMIVNDKKFDFKDSKINKMVENIIDNYHNNHAQDKGTQLVFCDLSVAKTRLDKLELEEKESENVNEISNNAAEPLFFLQYEDGEIEPIYSIEEYRQIASEKGLKLPKDEKNYQDIIEEVILDENGDKIGTQYKFGNVENIKDIGEQNNKNALEGVSFDVYSDVAKKLIKSGIPRDEIAFIHDYKSTEEKAKLYTKVNNGEIRILIGSTAKMGTGMNVQRRLVALHNLDYPWNPAGYEQRIGRIERQGNMFYEQDKSFKPLVYNYLTEKTYDAKALQLLESKQAAFDNFYNANQKGINECEDVIEGAIDFNELKAYASGNPLLIEENKINSKLEKEERQYKFWLLNKELLKDDIEEKQNSIKSASHQLYIINDIKNGLSEYIDEREKLKKRDLNLKNPIRFKIYDTNGNEIISNLSDKTPKEEREKIKKMANHYLRANISSAFNEINNSYVTKQKFKALACIKGVAILLYVSKNETNTKLYLKRDCGYSNGELHADDLLENIENGVTFRILETDKSFVLSEKFNFDYLSRKIDDSMLRMDTLSNKLKYQIEELQGTLKENIEILSSIPETYPQMNYFNALRKDKEIIGSKIAQKDFSWQPSYKSIEKSQKEAKLETKNEEQTKESMVKRENSKSFDLGI